MARTDITIPANAASGSVTIAFTANVDTEVEADGETVVFVGGLRNLDGTTDTSFTVSRTTLTINDPVVAPTGLTLSFDPATVTESADPTTITVTATFVGGTFTTERVVTFNSRTGDGTAGTATEVDDYTAVSNTNLTIPANAASGTTTFPFTAAVDTVAEPDGETVEFEGSLFLMGTTLPFDTTVTVTGATITINDPPAPGTDTAPTFSVTSITAQTFTVGTAVNLSLPTATGGEGAIVYALSLAIPGLTLDAATGVLTGTPDTAAAATDYTYTAGDTDGSAAGTDEASLTFSITVSEMTGTGTLSFGDATIGDLTYTQGTEITPVTLPVATNARFYSVTPALPAGLSFNTSRSSRVLSGTPTTVGMTTHTTHTYRASDIFANADTITFTITVNAPAAGTPPSSQTLTISPTTVTESATPTDITATVALVGGTYAVERVFSLGLQGGTAAIDDDYMGLSNVNLTIPANMASGTMTFSFTALADSVADDGETVMVASSLFVVGGGGFDTSLPPAFATLTINDPGDTTPAFANGETIPAQDLTVGVLITPLTLPTATGGNGALTYTVTPALPDGLTFDGAATPPTITGTPTTVATTVTHTYTATDMDGDTAGITFRVSVMVSTPPTAFTLAVTPATVTESATATDLTATVTLMGGRFTAERVVLVGEASGGSATSGTDYTAVADTPLTIPANAASASVVIPFTATDDMADEAGGETVNFDGTLLTADGMGVDQGFTVATASITINDPGTNLVPTFGGVTITAQTFTTGTAVDLTLPEGHRRQRRHHLQPDSPQAAYAITDLSTVIPGLTLDVRGPHAIHRRAGPTA